MDYNKDSNISGPPLSATGAELPPGPPVYAGQSAVSPYVPFKPGPVGANSGPIDPIGKWAGELENVYQLATLGTRFWAWLFDLVIISFIAAIINRFIPTGGYAARIFGDYFMVDFMFAGIIGLAYFACMTRYFGQTLGKMLLGIRVISVDGSPLTWNTVLFREIIGRTVSQFLGLYLGYFFAFFTEKRQSLHDVIADTYVVKERFTFERAFVKLRGKAF